MVPRLCTPRGSLVKPNAYFTQPNSASDALVSEGVQYHGESQIRRRERGFFGLFPGESKALLNVLHSRWFARRKKGLTLMFKHQTQSP